MRPLFRFVAQSDIREILVVIALPIIVGIGVLMQFLGFSVALATFLAGMELVESEYRHELEMDLDPFKGLLLVAFFMAVGGGIDFKLLMSNPASY
jgi:Kef-type K+ transport system membrane component KefB